MISNKFMTLQPELKVNKPTDTERRKRFSKIRQVIKKKN